VRRPASASTSRPRWARLVLPLLVPAGAYLVVAGCSSPEVQAVVTVEGGLVEGGASARSWGGSGCGVCVVATCVEESTRCRAEPTCARHLDCLAGCPATEEGEPDPFCAAACAPPKGSAAIAARTAFERCRTNGAGVACDGCRARAGAFRHPILEQVCENPTWDAGPDADVVAESCTKCVGERCCGSRDRCRANPDCAALRACQLACSDADGGSFRVCSDSCAQQYKSVVGMYYEWIECASIRCKEPCGLPADKCTDCFLTTCANEWIECESQNDCNLLLRCYGNCSDETCEAACDPQYPTGRDPLSRFLLCIQSSCLGCL
jgi:hypothetical protein